jgi:hypothetical protein
MAGKITAVDAAIIFGGLAIIIVSGILFAAFPMYQLLDNSIVRRPLWNPPSVIIREPGQGLTPEDIARLEQDPRQRELLQGLKDGMTYQPLPSWLGFHRVEVNQPLRGRRLPSNGLLYVFLGSVIGSISALRYRGII